MAGEEGEVEKDEDEDEDEDDDNEEGEWAEGTAGVALLLPPCAAAAPLCLRIERVAITTLYTQ